MAQIKLGRIGIVPKGEWNNIFTYNRLDLVAFDGGGYVSIADNNTNKMPTDVSSWLQISEKGETGNIDNLEDWHIVDALGYTPANKAVVDAHKAEKAPHAETISRTITVGVGKDFAKIQEALDSLKKRLEAIITINVDAGYFHENVIIRGFLGGGRIIINGGDSISEAINYGVSSFFVVSNLVQITVTGFDARNGNDPFRASWNNNIQFSKCRTESEGELGFYIEGSNADIGNCLASNKGTVLYASKGAIVFSNTWEAGTNNVRGIWSRGASTVGKYGTQPSGTTAEVADQGGAIR